LVVADARKCVRHPARAGSICDCSKTTTGAVLCVGHDSVGGEEERENDVRDHGVNFSGAQSRLGRGRRALISLCMYSVRRSRRISRKASTSVNS
jgi:hypothetical protein